MSKLTVAVVGLAMMMQGLLTEAGAQQVGAWKNFTDMKSLRAVAVSNGVVWGATSGGLFSSTGETIVKYTNAEGLSSNDLSALAVDTLGRIWIGSNQGNIDIYDPASRQWLYLGDVALSNQIQKGIRSFWITKDSVLVGTDFGISVFRLSRWEFGDTYANFGFTTQAAVSEILVLHDQLWVATNRGVATAPRYGLNLSSPSSWTQFQRSKGLPSDTVTSIVAYRDTVVVGTDAGVAYEAGAGFQVIPSSLGMKVKSLMPFAGSLAMVWNQPTYSVSLLNDLTIVTSPTYYSGSWAATDIAQDPSASSVFIGTAGNGIHQRGSASATIVPNGPASNLFSSLAVDAQGVLWCASGISGEGNGFYRYNPGLPEQESWKNFTNSDDPLMGSNDFYKVGVGADGSVWVSSWGRGAVQVVQDSIVRKIDTSTKPSFSTSTDADPSYPVVNGVAVDQLGQTWFANWNARNRNFLACLTNDTTFAYYTSNLISQGLFTDIAIDQNGTKWMANAEPFHPAKGLYLYYLNENGLVPGTSSTGGWGLMTEAEGLPNNTIYSVAVDRDGSVCVGTALGLMIISDPLFPRQRHFSSFPLREQTIQAIAVDAVNDKWVGTKEGVFVMNSDATQILQQYTVSSTGGKLVDNDIRAIAIDQLRGTAYIGTEKGLSSISIAPVATVRSFGIITVGPNPYRVPATVPLEIRNLVADSYIKILSVDGSLVTEFPAQGGGRAFWDGKDSSGRVVGSGIYFVIAYAENGDQVGSAKVAVIRQ